MDINIFKEKLDYLKLIANGFEEESQAVFELPARHLHFQGRINSIVINGIELFEECEASLEKQRAFDQFTDYIKALQASFILRNPLPVIVQNEPTQVIEHNDPTHTIEQDGDKKKRGWKGRFFITTTASSSSSTSEQHADTP